MYISEIILDGFKSYATRTVISGFDPQFNAFTGKNGSGKSNILDAICFVLGISNLTQVRAGCLQDLVYKQGQAGVTKATVTIVFNNEDKNQSPVGYEQHSKVTVTRQIAIGGRNKYLINGNVAQLNRVQNLFHSVQLNINNPHFLIMQGRITKVINMKPPELLSMIEEAAGTKMYQSKKEAALKTIDKKQAKVEEISKILQEKITPSLEKLRTERSQYMQWSALNSEVEHLERFCVAYDYQHDMELVSEGESRFEEMEKELNDNKAESSALQRRAQEKSDELDRLRIQRERDAGTDIKELDTTVSELSKRLVKATSAWQHKSEGLTNDETALETLLKSVEDLTAAVATKGKELEQAKVAVDELTANTEGCAQQVAALQQLILSGTASDAAQGEKNLADQLMDEKKRATDASTAIQQAETRIAHFESELGSKQKQVKALGKEFEAQQAEQKSLEREIQDLEKQCSATGFDEGRKKELDKELATETRTMRDLRDKAERLQSQVANIDFSYAEPFKGFDHSKVKGLVAKLLTVEDKAAATALQVAAGGRLFQVVVEDDETGKALLQRGQLKRRVTIIPLNKIRSGVLDDRVLATAQKTVGADRARLALSLIGYDDEVEAAMQYVFGKTIVCKDDEAAKHVAFDKNIKAKAVTLAGDVFDPSGTLTGGSRPGSGANVLVKLGELASAREELEACEARIADLNKQLSKMASAGKAYAQIDRQLSLKKHELELLQKRVKQSTGHKLSEEIASLEAGLAEAHGAIKEAQVAKKAAEKKSKELEKEIGNAGAGKERQEKENAKKLGEAKKRHTELGAKLNERVAEVEAMETDVADTVKELEGSKAQIGQAESAIEAARKDVAAAEEAAAAMKEEFEAGKAELDAKRALLKEADKEASLLAKEVDRLGKEAQAKKLEAKKLEHAIANHARETKEASKSVKHLEAKHPWIEHEKGQFGRSGGDYDFAKMDPAEAKRKLQSKAADHERLGKKINKKVMTLFDKAEQEYHELVRKKRIIENDKEKIEKVIDELDEKKNLALKTAWGKINRDFGSIFSTLLPGAQAKLEPMQGCDVLDGLEFRVGFGDCWKESLSELSGGQRSLLALSLILAMLLFKPAPMYILDEVDAALDLSHTQNIGVMLRTHFKHSQFLVVSLKEGMFNNANVLYQMKFVDGVSTVTRRTPGIRSK